MPCYSPGADQETANEATRAACDALRILKALGQLGKLSHETKKWWAEHEERDARIEAATKKHDRYRALVKKLTDKLSKEEKEALRIYAREL